MLLFRSQGAFSRGESEFIIKKCAALLWQSEFIKKVHGAALSKVNLLKKCTALLWQNEFIKKVRGAILAEVNLL